MDFSALRRKESSVFLQLSDEPNLYSSHVAKRGENLNLQGHLER